MTRLPAVPWYYRAMMRLAVPVLLAALVGGCSPTETIDLHNVETGQLTRCEVVTDTSALATAGSIFRGANSRRCPSDFETAGWRRVN